MAPIKLCKSAVLLELDVPASTSSNEFPVSPVLINPVGNVKQILVMLAQEKH